MTAFSFVHISDHHLFESENLFEYGFSTAYAFRQVLRHISKNMAQEIDFLVTTGDVAKTPSTKTYQYVSQLLQARSTLELSPGKLLVSLEGLQDFPMYVLPGNLDDRDNFYRHLLPHTPPMSRLNFVFEHKGVRFVCMDWGPQSKAIGSPDLFDFLTTALQTELPLIMFMHHHITPVGFQWMDDFLADNVGDFLSLVAQQNVLGIFCGHTHCTYETTVQGIPVYGVRSTAPQFVPQAEPLLCLEAPHYRLVNVNNGVLTTQIYEVPL